MRRSSHEILIWNQVTPKSITSSTDATPIVVTCTSHGFQTGDLVMINGHTTNVAANGLFKITRLTSSTFSLQDYNTGSDIVGSGGGAGSGGVVVLAPKILSVSDYRNVVFSIETSGSANFTIKVAGSVGNPTSNSHGDTPNFGATQSASNQYQFVQIINLDTSVSINGATGITTSGTDIHTMYEVNTNVLKYLTFVLTNWTAGTITIKAQLSDNL